MTHTYVFLLAYCCLMLDLYYSWSNIYVLHN